MCDEPNDPISVLIEMILLNDILSRYKKVNGIKYCKHVHYY